MRPGIVCVELRAWGREGPWRERRGFDTIVQTATRMALVSGGGTEPRLMPVSAIDCVSGHLMASARWSRWRGASRREEVGWCVYH
jgi:crotonobetainyl-CoA:carnitine CoA-transferase CaiB-like acyl-CoA transferase